MSVELRCKTFSCHCSLVLFENLTEGKKKKFQVWNVEFICTSWALKKKKKIVVDSSREVVKEVIFSW